MDTASKAAISVASGACRLCRTLTGTESPESPVLLVFILVACLYPQEHINAGQAMRTLHMCDVWCAACPALLAAQPRPPAQQLMECLTLFPVSPCVPSVNRPPLTHSGSNFPVSPFALVKTVQNGTSPPSCSKVKLAALHTMPVSTLFMLVMSSGWHCQSSTGDTGSSWEAACFASAASDTPLSVCLSILEGPGGWECSTGCQPQDHWAPVPLTYMVVTSTA